MALGILKDVGERRRTGKGVRTIFMYHKILKWTT